MPGPEQLPVTPQEEIAAIARKIMPGVETVSKRDIPNNVSVEFARLQLEATGSNGAFVHKQYKCQVVTVDGKKTTRYFDVGTINIEKIPGVTVHPQDVILAVVVENGAVVDTHFERGDIEFKTEH